MLKLLAINREEGGVGRGVVSRLPFCEKLIHFIFIAGGVCHSDVSLQGKTAIVTGGNTG